MLVSNTASLSVYTLKKICVLGFLHQVLAAISGEKTALGPFFVFKLSMFSLNLLRLRFCDLVMLNL